jgi:hypothetical protein
MKMSTRLLPPELDAPLMDCGFLLRVAASIFLPDLCMWRTQQVQEEAHRSVRLSFLRTSAGFAHYLSES